MAVSVNLEEITGPFWSPIRLALKRPQRDIGPKKGYSGSVLGSVEEICYGPLVQGLQLPQRDLNYGFLFIRIPK